MFSFRRKKSFLKKCSDGVLEGLAEVGDVVIATGEVVGDAFDALTTPTTQRETIVVHKPVVVEKHTTVVTTNSWAECEARRLRQETMRLREENLRMERELAERHRREAERETEALDDIICTNYGSTYRVTLLIKGNAYKVVVKNCDLGITVFDETFYTAARAYNEFRRRKDILRNR